MKVQQPQELIIRMKAKLEVNSSSMLTYSKISSYIYVCVCVCVCVYTPANSPNQAYCINNLEKSGHIFTHKGVTWTLFLPSVSF